MKVLLVNQYFWPDRAATAQLLTDLAEDLVEAGFEVRALAGKGTYAPGREGPLPSREEHRGVAVRRVPCTDFGRGRLLGRLLDYGTFLVSAALAVLFGPRADAVVCLSTPPLVAVLGLLARLRGARFVYKVEDLYPDTAVALGALEADSLLARILARVSCFVLARADRVVALDAAMGETLARRGARHVTVLPNWADGKALAPDPEAGRRFRDEEDLPPDAFVVLYSGNLGMAHRFDAIVEAVRRTDLPTAAGPSIFWLFVGAGPRRAEVESAVEGQANVRFLPYQPRQRLRALYNAADTHLVTLRDAVAGLLVPSKYSAALACGKPVTLVGGRGADMEREIREQGVGWALPHDPEAITAAVRDAASSPPDRAAAREAAARAVFDREYDRHGVTRRWTELLRSLDDSPDGEEG
jgi:colanic acid biosynthesis glycosyl transferase WcaI